MGMIPEGERMGYPAPLTCGYVHKRSTEKEFPRFGDCEGCKKFDKCAFVIYKVYIYIYINDNINGFCFFCFQITCIQYTFIYIWHQWNPLFFLQREGEDVQPWPLWNVFYQPKEAPSNDLCMPGGSFKDIWSLSPFGKGIKITWLLSFPSYFAY